MRDEVALCRRLGEATSNRIPNSAGSMLLSLEGFSARSVPTYLQVLSQIYPRDSPWLALRFLCRRTAKIYKCIHDIGTVFSSDLALIFRCSISISSRTRIVRLSTSSLVSFDVLTGGRTAESHQTSPESSFPRQPWTRGSFTFDPDLSSVEPLPFKAEDTRIIHRHDRNNRHLGLHRKMKSSLLERQEIWLVEIWSCSFREEQNAALHPQC